MSVFSREAMISGVSTEDPFSSCTQRDVGVVRGDLGVTVGRASIDVVLGSGRTRMYSWGTRHGQAALVAWDLYLEPEGGLM